MSTLALSQPRPSAFALGRTYLHPAFDYLLIGGGLSLVVTALVATSGTAASPLVLASLPLIVLLSNLAHFAASTVRLYTKPGAFVSHRFLTMGLPLVTLGVMTLAVWQAEALGGNLQALYLTWSPFHYAAQSYGLAVMYCYRSGYALGAGEKRLVRVASLLPFLYAFFDGHQSGFSWLVPASVLSTQPSLLADASVVARVLALATLIVPVALLGGLGLRRPGLPLISLLVLVTNGIWWVTLRYLDAFFWATVFHGVQYLAITLIFHVREQVARPGNRHGWLRHTLQFYGLCVALGYVLFKVWPSAYVALGFGWAESALLATAVINIHHFVVDAYIWRLRRDPNYRVVASDAPAAVPGAA
jgi:hypothetical protein